MTSPGPLTVDAHLAEVLAAVEPQPAYEQHLLDALGLPVADDIISPVSTPLFDNSGMDGYAVVFRDVAEANERPVHLPVVGEIAAGSGPARTLAPGTAMKIMTGAQVPDGCTAVVPIEWTDQGRERVQINRAPVDGQHIRRAGEDVTRGDLLVKGGTVLDPRQLGLLASVGISQVSARPRPRVVIMSTGAELVEPGLPLSHDQIYDANSYLLSAAARAAGATPYRVNASSDDPEAFVEALSDQLVRADLVVTSGGVSKGDHDVVKEALSPLGTVAFREVLMQPGKPQGFGVVGEDATPIFTLPGNPVSSYVSFQVFVVPAIRKLMGRAPLSRPLVRGIMTETVGSPVAPRQFLRGHFESRNGGSTVTPIGGPGSHLVGGLAAANCLIVLGEGVNHVEAGDAVPVMLLDRDY